MYYYFLLESMIVFGIAYGEGSEGRIIGGRFAKKGEFPYFVVISFRPYSSSCGGGILSPLYVLTACHCTTEVIEPFGELPQRLNGNYGNTRVIAGTISRDGPYEQGYQLRWVYQWMQHPKCLPLLTGEWVYDIAVIQVAARFIFNLLVQPINLPTTQLRLTEIIKMYQVIQRSCIIAGWGLTTVEPYGKYGNASKYMKAILTRLLPAYHCNRLLCDFSRYTNCMEALSVQTPDRVCAASKYSKSGTICRGDSGGPLVCGGTAVGVVSYSSGCSILDDPVVYARTDTAFDFFSKYYVHSPDYVGD